MTVPIIHLVVAWKKAASQAKRDQLAKLIDDVLRPQLDRFFPKLYSASDFEDFQQIVMAAVFGKIRVFRGETDLSFYSLFNKIASNKAVDLNRKHERANRHIKPLTAEEMQDILEKVAKIEPPSMELRIDLEHALILLDKLKPLCRKLLMDYYCYGRKQVEIAASLGLKNGNIHMQMTRCLRHLHTLI